MLRTAFVVLLAVGMAVAGPVIRTNRSENDTSSVAPANEVVTESSSSVAPEVTAETSTATAEASTTTAVAVTSKPRKTITFDQRQQGKFNIRADLENFVIVVVPSSPSAGISLLDLLNRSGQKGALQKKKSAHRKGIKHHGAQKKAHHTTTPEVVVLDESHGRVDNEEFIEGRTPYRVDISARSNDVPTADMPSPIYRVMRPLNYEQPAASNMIRFPSPSSSSSSGNYFEDGDGSTVERQAKALAPGAERFDEIRTNTVYAILTNNNNNNNHGGDGMIEADEDDEDNYLTYAQERTYLDLPPFHPASSFDSLDDGEYPRSDVDMAKLQLQQQGDDFSTLKLLGAQEQCGPDRRRDSYGVCQFVTP